MTAEDDIKPIPESIADEGPVTCEVKYLNQNFGPRERKVFEEYKQGTESHQENWWNKYAFYLLPLRKAGIGWAESALPTTRPPSRCSSWFWTWLAKNLRPSSQPSTGARRPRPGPSPLGTCDLWALFPPGEIGYAKLLDHDCASEYVRRPLCMVSSGGLGDDAIILDASLRRIMDLAATWKAVLLIDEADVFMERRDAFNLSRKSMVSVFLRHLECYKGILFLTTNRVLSFDEAFKSRIYIPSATTICRAILAGRSSSSFTSESLAGLG
jgi:hypothetical protein